MKRVFFKCFILSLGFVMFLLSNQVYSAWCYAEENAGDITSSLSATLQGFEYTPEEVLPDDEEGKNHVVLVETLVGEQKGLNKPDSYLNEQISSRKNGGLFKPKRDTLGSMGVDQGDELEKLFSLDSKSD